MFMSAVRKPFNMKKSKIIRKAQKDATAEIRAQAGQTLKREGNRLNLILGMFCLAAMYLSLLYSFDMLFYLLPIGYGTGAEYSSGYINMIINISVLLIPALLLMPLFTGYRIMEYNTVRYGKTDIRDIFCMCSSFKNILIGIRASFMTVLRVGILALLLSGWMYSDTFCNINKVYVLLIGLVILPIWLYLTRMWAVTPYLLIPDTVKGRSFRDTKKAARKYYAATLMSGTLNSFIWLRILSVITVFIYGIADVYPKIIISKAFVADRVIKLINNERIGQNND